MKMQVLVRLKSGVLDVQGKAVEKSLEDLGFGQVGKVRIGKLVEFEVNSSNESEAKEIVQSACERLLVNPIIETFEVKAGE